MRRGVTRYQRARARNDKTLRINVSFCLCRVFFTAASSFADERISCVINRRRDFLRTLSRSALATCAPSNINPSSRVGLPAAFVRAKAVATWRTKRERSLPYCLAFVMISARRSVRGWRLNGLSLGMGAVGSSGLYNGSGPSTARLRTVEDVYPFRISKQVSMANGEGRLICRTTCPYRIS